MKKGQIAEEGQVSEGVIDRASAGWRPERAALSPGDTEAVESTCSHSLVHCLQDPKGR